MAKVFRSMVQMQQGIQNLIPIALEKTATRMVEELKNYILEDYYNQYSPKIYTRTYQLLHSAKFELLSANSAQVFIDIDSIHYLIGDPSYEGTEEDIIKLASLGYHGTTNIFREGMFWEDFLDWCEKNVPFILRSELMKLGFRPM